MTTFRNTMIAGAAGLAMIAAGSVAMPSQAHANGKLVGALLGGLVLGSVISATQRPAYATPTYGVVYKRCWNQPATAYDNWGRPYTTYVQVCG